MDRPRLTARQLMALADAKVWGGLLRRPYGWSMRGGGAVGDHGFPTVRSLVDRGLFLLSPNEQAVRLTSEGKAAAP